MSRYSVGNKFENNSSINTTAKENSPILKEIPLTQTNSTYKIGLNIEKSNSEVQLSIEDLLYHKWFQQPAIRNELCRIPYFFTKVKCNFIDNLLRFNPLVDLEFVRLFSKIVYWNYSIVDTRMIFNLFFFEEKESLNLNRNDFILGYNKLLESFSPEESQHYGFDVIDSGSISMLFDKIKSYFNKSDINQEMLELANLNYVSQSETSIRTIYAELIKKQNLFYASSNLPDNNLTSNRSSTTFSNIKFIEEKLHADFLTSELNSLGKISKFLDNKIKNETELHTNTELNHTIDKIILLQEKNAKYKSIDYFAFKRIFYGNYST